MAINFLNKVDFNQNEIDKARLANYNTDALAGTPVDGQLYYNAIENVVKVGEGGVWVSISGDITALTQGTYINIDDPNGPIPTINHDLTTRTDTALPAGGITPGYGGNFNFVDSVSTNSTGHVTAINLNNITIPAASSEWTARGEIGSQLVSFGDTVNFLNDTNGGIDTKVDTSTADVSVIFKMDVQDLTTNTSPATGDFIPLSPAAGGGTSKATISSVIDLVPTYALPVTAGTVSPGTPTSGIITLTDNGVVSDPVNFKGTAGRVDVSGDAGTSSIIIDLTDDVTIANNLTVSGVITQQQTGGTNIFSSPFNMGGITGTPAPNKIINLATGTDPKDAVNLAQVVELIAGVGVFQGGYNATTDPGVPVISGSANVALEQGDYFVVSHDGDITFSGTTTTGVNSGALNNSTALLLTAANTDIEVGMDVTGTGVPPGITILTVTNSTNFVLSSAITIVNTTTLTFSDKVVSVEVGDFIFANAKILPNTDPAKTAYTIVQSDANIAGAGATDGATEKGVAGFDSASFDVSASGWVQLNSQRNPYGATQTLDNTGPVSRTELNNLTTFTIDLADTTLFGAGALAKNVTAEVTQNVAPYQTVYADVTRSGSASMSIVFSGSVAVDIYRVLLTHI